MFRILKAIDIFRPIPLCYEVQIRRKWWIFSWWEYLRDDSWDSIIRFSDREEAIKYARYFLKSRIAYIEEVK